METVQPQTIVIRSVPTKTPTTITVSTPFENAMLDDLYGDGDGCPRKRRRLTHLSPEEKLLRRKLKNRVAAQTARDRKKNQMAELELKVAELERENQKLAAENNSLKAESGSLQQENEVLKERLSNIGCSPVKTETGPGSAERTDPACVLLREDLRSFNADFQSDALVSLLKQNKEQTNPKSTSTVQLQSLPGYTVSKSTNSAGTTVVGPSATELESLQELIQFDHVYYKTQPEGKSSNHSPTVLQIKPKPAASVSPKCVQKVTENGLKNVKIIITRDSDKKNDSVNKVVQIPNVILDTKMLEKSKLSSKAVPKLSCLKNLVEPIQINEDNIDLTDLNFDLLNDLESILSQDCDGLTYPDNTNELLQVNMGEELTKSVNSVQKGQKRKAPSSEIEAIMDDLTADFPPSPTKSVLSVSDSGYSSDVPSPYSSQTASSPLVDDGTLLQESGWEESFTELFPDLI